MATLLGIDTGGTHTDAALVDADTGEVLVAAKVPTTHDDLAVGVAGAIDAVLSPGPVGAGAAPGAVALVSLSTTLATNALVEGITRRAGLVLVGFDDDAAERPELTSAVADTPVVRPFGTLERVPVSAIIATSLSRT